MDEVHAFESAVAERVVAIGRSHSDSSADSAADTSVDVWQYLAENIDEFAVAKSIVDHFDDHPKDLHGNNVDTLGLYLRAKVTIKREQISYAQAQQAVERARLQSQGLRGALKSASSFAADLRGAIRARPEAVLLASGFVLWLGLR